MEGVSLVERATKGRVELYGYADENSCLVPAV